ncbi:MAG: phosphoenolpyruvate synthase [Candidatus Colwellbacteria bacterium]|nr:phosphoenolpyruvate synthase [Candidatus Colwellbacteria bacterium]
MRNIIWFKELGIEDVPEVGGKNASLGEMYNDLTPKGIRIPDGFAITSGAYKYFLDKAGLAERMTEALKGLDTKKIANLQARGKKIREMMVATKLPSDLEDEISSAYRKMCEEFGRKNIDVAVRSSATAEDLPGASFAGQQETYLNITGEKALLIAVRKCFASLFTDRAISYREDKGFDHMKTYLSVGVQKMVRSDKASSGVAFTIDTETGFKNAVVVTGSWGLGELVVQGEVIPDEFKVFKPTLKEGYRSIIGRELGTKEITMVYGAKGNVTKTVRTSDNKRAQFILSDDEVVELAKWCVMIEDHYKKPMDIEWAKDGVTGELFIVQARPETVQAGKEEGSIEDYIMHKAAGKLLAKGAAVGSKIAEGKANIIKDVRGIKTFKKGEVLVTKMTDPDWEPIMKIAAAIVTDEGGRTSHAAIVSRELGIPCIVGSGNATKNIRPGQLVTVDCSTGGEGNVWNGKAEWEVKRYKVDMSVRPKTKIMMNIGSPDEAFEASFLPNDGVGLAREEFIIAGHIKVHPMALIEFAKLKDKKAKAEIEKLTRGYKKKTDFYVDKLAEGIGQIAAAFYPKPVILRFSDFKTNEYATLLGGKEFEPEESNPMIGWRGASRYYHPAFEKAFGLECEAVKRVREEFGLKNLVVMVPFCRTVDEGKQVIAKMAEYGLKQGDDGLKVYAMCEIPSNVILADEFLSVFDGFSIGSNDLTQLTVGIDRDSTSLGYIANEKDGAVKKLISQVIKAANAKGKYIGICGQAPSDYEDFATFLVEEGIHSMSLNPDTVIKTTTAIIEKERKLGK